MPDPLSPDQVTDPDIAEATAYANAGPSLGRKTTGRLVARLETAEADLAALRDAARAYLDAREKVEHPGPTADAAAFAAYVDAIDCRDGALAALRELIGGGT